MTDLTIANTILAQLGGRRFIAMTGARNLIGSENALSFRLPRANQRINSVRIVLAPSDTYTVTFMRIRRKDGALTVTEVDKHEDVYVDMLREVFERVTGLATSLGTMGRPN